MRQLLNLYLPKLKSISYYVIASLFTALIGIAINPFLSIGLSHKDYAIIGYYSSFTVILGPIIAFSFNSYYARNYFLVSEFKRVKIYKTLMSLFLVFGMLVFFVFSLIYYIYHINRVNSIPFSPYAILSFLPVYFSSFYNIYLLQIRMEQKAKKYAIITILNTTAAGMLSLFLVYVLNYGAIGRLIALLIVAVAFGIYALNIKKFEFSFNKKIIKEAFIFCWPLTITAILTFFFMGIDRVFLEEMNDNHNLGLYNVGIQITSYLGIFGTVLFQTFEPDLFRYTSLNQHKKVFYFVLLITFATLIPNLIFIILSKPLINILTYGKYTEAASFANILCLKNVGTSFAFSLSNVLVGYGFSKYELFNRILGALFSLLLYKYLIDHYGFYGAAWGQTLSWIIMGLISILSIYFLRRKINLVK